MTGSEKPSPCSRCNKAEHCSVGCVGFYRWAVRMRAQMRKAQLHIPMPSAGEFYRQVNGWMRKGARR